MTTTWHKPRLGDFLAWTEYTSYRDSDGWERFVFLIPEGEHVLVRTWGGPRGLLKEERRGSLEAAKKLIEKRARRAGQTAPEPTSQPRP